MMDIGWCSNTARWLTDLAAVSHSGASNCSAWCVFCWSHREMLLHYYMTLSTNKKKLLCIWFFFFWRKLLSSQTQKATNFSNLHSKKKKKPVIKSLQSQSNQASPCFAVSDSVLSEAIFWLTGSLWLNCDCWSRRWPALVPLRFSSSFLLACGKQLGDWQPDITAGACNHGAVKTQIQQPQTVWPRHSGGI